MRSMIDAAGLLHDGVVDRQELQKLYTTAATKIYGSVEEALAVAAERVGYDQDTSRDEAIAARLQKDEEDEAKLKSAKRNVLRALAASRCASGLPKTRIEEELEEELGSSSQDDDSDDDGASQRRSCCRRVRDFVRLIGPFPHRRGRGRGRAAGGPGRAATLHDALYHC